MSNVLTVSLSSKRFGTSAYGVVKLFATVASLGLLASNCASHTELRAKFMHEFRIGSYEVARDVLVDTTGKKDDNFLVDIMDLGMTLHRLGRYEESNRYLEIADDRIKEHFTTEISEVLQAIAWNESAAPYKGEEYERNLVDIIQAFNYLCMGNLQGALIEARQVSHKLDHYTSLLEAHEIESAYKSDPFASYLAALIYEAGGSYDDAYLSYRKAHSDYSNLGEAYNVSMPEPIADDLVRTAQLSGRYSEADEWRHHSSIGNERERVQGHGEIVVIIGIGQIAHKVSRKWEVKDGSGDEVVVTYPEYQKTPSKVMDARVAVDGHGEVNTETLHELSTLAMEVMKERNEAVKDRAVARAIARYALKKTGRIVTGSNSTVAKAAGIATWISINIAEQKETADTRSWLTLPEKYLVARVWVRPGSVNVIIEFQTNGYVSYQREVRQVDVEPGSKAFIVVHSHEPGN